MTGPLLTYGPVLFVGAMQRHPSFHACHPGADSPFGRAPSRFRATLRRLIAAGMSMLHDMAVSIVPVSVPGTIPVEDDKRDEDFEPASIAACGCPKMAAALGRQSATCYPVRSYRRAARAIRLRRRGTCRAPSFHHLLPAPRWVLVCIPSDALNGSPALGAATNTRSHRPAKKNARLRGRSCFRRMLRGLNQAPSRKLLRLPVREPSESRSR